MAHDYIFNADLGLPTEIPLGTDGLARMNFSVADGVFCPGGERCMAGTVPQRTRIIKYGKKVELGGNREKSYIITKTLSGWSFNETSKTVFNRSGTLEIRSGVVNTLFKINPNGNIGQYNKKTKKRYHIFYKSKKQNNYGGYVKSHEGLYPNASYRKKWAYCAQDLGSCDLEAYVDALIKKQ